MGCVSIFRRKMEAVKPKYGENVNYLHSGTPHYPDLHYELTSKFRENYPKTPLEPVPEEEDVTTESKIGYIQKWNKMMLSLNYHLRATWFYLSKTGINPTPRNLEDVYYHLYPKYSPNTVTWVPPIEERRIEQPRLEKGETVLERLAKLKAKPKSKFRTKHEDFPFPNWEPEN